MRPEYVPTADQRALVVSASAFGLTQAEIATQLKISEPTLRKHFRDELDGGAFKANMKVGGNMYALTQSADEQVRLRACQWWTARRMGWKETNVKRAGWKGRRPDRNQGRECN
jgi:AraC-like DNA-binding protein